MSKDSLPVCSQPVLGQLLSLIPRDIVSKCVASTKADKWYKRLKTWDHLVFLVYGVLTKSSSLREIERNLLLFGNKIIHLGLKCIPKRSTVSDANKHRNSSVFGLIYSRLYQHYKGILSDSYLSLPIQGEIDPKRVEIFDSTTVTLFKDIFKGCGRIPKNGRRKGGLKAFSQMNLSEWVPNFVCLRDASTSERSFLADVPLTQGSIAVFDKGFHKYEMYQEWTEMGIFYVTRMNDNAKFAIVKYNSIEEACDIGVQTDAIIELAYQSSDKGQKMTRARLVAYIDPESGKRLTFLTNLMDTRAETICVLYKNRWHIETLFKQIKQNFDLSHFLSDSPEGIKTQIWVALILNLIFTVIHRMTKQAEEFRTMVRLAAKNTTNHVGLMKFLCVGRDQSDGTTQNLDKMQLELFLQYQETPLLRSP